MPYPPLSQFYRNCLKIFFKGRVVNDNQKSIGTTTFMFKITATYPSNSFSLSELKLLVSPSLIFKVKQCLNAKKKMLA